MLKTGPDFKLYPPRTTLRHSLSESHPPQWGAPSPSLPPPPPNLGPAAAAGADSAAAAPTGCRPQRLLAASLSTGVGGHVSLQAAARGGGHWTLNWSPLHSAMETGHCTPHHTLETRHTLQTLDRRLSNDSSPQLLTTDDNPLSF